MQRQKSLFFAPFPLIIAVHISRALLLLLFLCLLGFPTTARGQLLNSGLERCRLDDFTFHYTACDEKGERWRYALPKSQRLRYCANTPPPVPGLNCSFSCPSGTYLDMGRQECRLCSAGTFSLGNGIRYEQLSRLPPGFSVENFPDETAHSQQRPLTPNSYASSNNNEEEDDADLGAWGGKNGRESCPLHAGWVLESGELRYLPTPCVSKLTISVSLAHDGYVRLLYRMPRSSRGLISILQVKDAECSGSSANAQQPASILLPHLDTTGEAAQVEEGGLHLRRLPLPRGQHQITWVVASNRETTSLADVIHLPIVDIYGLAFTTSCSPCPAGSYSESGGAKQCKACPPNSYSLRGAIRCEACPIGGYSIGRAVRCDQRPICDPTIDYYPVAEPSTPSTGCKKATGGGGWTREARMERVKPEICLVDNSLQQPTSTMTHRTEACAATCNPGYKRNQLTGECVCCGDGEFSTDGLVCGRCSNNTQPNHGLYLTSWDRWYPQVSTSCEYISIDRSDGEREQQGGGASQMASTSSDCGVSPAWVLRGGYVETVQTRAVGVAFELAINIPGGFHAPLRWGGERAKPTLENPIAEMQVDVETRCRDESCQFYLIQDLSWNSTSGPASSSPAYSLLHSMNGTQPRHALIAPILSSLPTRFTLVFMRSGAGLDRDSVTDKALVYSINVTNLRRSEAEAAAVGMGSSACLPCPVKAAGGVCKPCPLSHYMGVDGIGCTPCPQGTVLNMSSSSRVGPASCVPCPEHMDSDEESGQCRFTGRFQLRSSSTNQTMHFDLSPLRNIPLHADGVKVFGGRGGAYYHSFNVSLFPDRAVRCADSANSDMGGGPTGRGVTMGGGEGYASGSSGDVLFCRSAAIPQVQQSRHGKNGSGSATAEALYISSTVIGRKLAAITLERTYLQHFHLSNDQLEYESSISDHLPLGANRPLDIHFFFEPTQTSSSIAGPATQQCPRGLIGVITARCISPASGQGSNGGGGSRLAVARLSKRCPDGTCDGCLYHVLVESPHACPICHPKDFEVIWGECIDGQRAVHSIPSKQCILSGAEAHQRMEPCTDLTSRVRLITFSAVLAIVTLMFIIGVCYQRNRAMEYRYMRILEEGKENEMGALSTVESCALDDDSDYEEDEAAETAAQMKETRLEVGMNGRQDVSATRVYFAKVASKLTGKGAENPQAKRSDGDRGFDEVDMNGGGGVQRHNKHHRGETQKKRKAKGSIDEMREFLTDSSD